MRATARSPTGVASLTASDPEMAALVREAAVGVAGVEQVITGKQIMGSEDFSEFTQRVPSCFFFVGSRDEASGKVWSHHHPRFDIDERSLAIGAEVMVRSAVRYLEANAG